MESEENNLLVGLVLSLERRIGAIEAALIRRGLDLTVDRYAQPSQMRHVTPEIREEMVRMYSSKMHETVIANQTGFSQKCVHDQLRKAGVLPDPIVRRKRNAK